MDKFQIQTLEEKIKILIQQAVTIAQQGNGRRAIQTLLPALNLNSQHLDTRNLLGLLYWQNGDAASAIDHFMAALQVDPSHRQTLINLGNVYYCFGKLDDACHYYGNCLDIYPDDEEVRAFLKETESKKMIQLGWQEFLSLLTNGQTVKLVRFFRDDTGELAGRLGELALGYDLVLRLQQLGRLPADEKYLFFSGRPANTQLQEMFKRELKIVENEALFEAVRTFAPIDNFNQIVDRLSAEYEVYQQTKATLRFTSQEEERGKRMLSELGIGENDWFVCVFARDPQYIALNYPDADHSHSNFRDADINSYHLATAEIAKAGGYVLRIGSAPDKPLGYSHPRLIDYATHYRNDFMDIYLQAHCRFCLGSPSGICEVTYLFDKPFLATNVVPYGYAPYGKDCLFIPKKVRDVATGDYVPFAKLVAELSDRHDPVLFDGAEQLARGYIYEDNTPEELLEVTIEMLQRLGGTFRQSDADLDLQMKYRQLIPSSHWNAHNKTPIGAAFLRRHSAKIFGWS